jgi:hypothetical protein
MRGEKVYFFVVPEYHQYSFSQRVDVDKPVNADIAPHTNILDGRKIEDLPSQYRNIFLKER